MIKEYVARKTALKIVQYLIYVFDYYTSGSSIVDL
jgi:hypothetical protein